MQIRFLTLLLSTVAVLTPGLANAQTSGKFDYYLLSLSWSPEYCYSHRNSPECGRHLGLVVHGLWPQYNNAPRGPENCGQQPGPSHPSTLLDIMPTLGLIQHEWLTHGTCSGLDADQYFTLVRQVFANFHTPMELQQPKQIILRAAGLKKSIEQANPNLSDNEIVLTCTGPYLKEVEICLTKEGKPQPCSAVHGCIAPSLRVPPIR